MPQALTMPIVVGTTIPAAAELLEATPGRRSGEVLMEEPTTTLSKALTPI